MLFLFRSSASVLYIDYSIHKLRKPIPLFDPRKVGFFKNFNQVDGGIFRTCETSVMVLFGKAVNGYYFSSPGFLREREGGESYMSTLLTIYYFCMIDLKSFLNVPKSFTRIEVVYSKPSQTFKMDV